MSSKKSSEKGQSLMELIVVITVIVFVVGALTFATIASLRNAVFAQNQAQATKLAQEGTEKVRSERDRGNPISGFNIGSDNIASWQDSNLWSNQINGNCGDIAATPPTYCYFKINNSGRLQYLTSASSIPLSTVEVIGLFKRAVILSDDVDFQTQKTVMVIVTWTDFSGQHESKLTTILRKL